jgi:hypothetical protein
VPVPVRAALAAGLAFSAIACASARPKTPILTVNLAPARAAIDEARKAGAPENAPETFKRAEYSLSQAESFAPQRGRAADARRFADLALAEGRAATAIARLVVEMKRGGLTPGAPPDRSLAARLRKAEEDQRRLEDRIELLQRDLVVTERELIRSKARLKGNETKAVASAAGAEAQILASRLAEDKTRVSTLARTRESLAKAEEQLGLGNYGAAIFFALKAQDTATRSTQETPR